MQKGIKSQKGITLVALVITIIVMLILVAVSVTVAINGGLFEKAKYAANEWEDKSKEEADGNIVNVDGVIMNIDSSINTLKDRPTIQTPGADTGTETQTITFGLKASETTSEYVQYTVTAGTSWNEFFEANPTAKNDTQGYELYTEATLQAGGGSSVDLSSAIQAGNYVFSMM